MDITNDQAKQFLHRIRKFLRSKHNLDVFDEFSQWVFTQSRITDAIEESFKSNTGVSMNFYYVDFIREVLGRNTRGEKSIREKMKEYRIVEKLLRYQFSPENEFNAKIDLEFLVEILSLEERVSVLMTMHGYLQSEIGVTLNRTESRVNQHLKEAFKKIKDYLKFREPEFSRGNLS